MTLRGKDVQMHLEQNEALLTKDYSEIHYTENGTKVTTTPKDLDHCYYHGTIVNDTESLVSISTCDGLRGYFQTAAQRYLIEPVSEDSSGDHAVIKYEDAQDKPVVCGVTNTSWFPDYPPRISKARSRAMGPTLLQQQKYVELYIVADNREYKKYNSDINEVRKRIFEIVNFVNIVYKPLNTFIALTGLEIWTDQDKMNVATPAGTTLDNFNTWKNSQQDVKRHDNAQLVTGIDFDGPTVGLAFIGTFCSSLSTGVIQDHNPRAPAVGATMSHEMGHNLGMNHDTSSCVCPDSTCIMAAALSYTIPQKFSSCSVDQYNQFLNSRNPECMLNTPDYTKILSPPVCGNGFQETGEECDCGTVEDCKNPCCNATTCTLSKGSDCAVGDCCYNCKIVPRNTECRKKRDDCDLPEYCDGKSAGCPEDVFAVNGHPCQDEKGYCYNGQCPQRENQCVKMWGPGTVLGTQNCFNQNSRGTYYAYCKRTDKYIPCQKQDVMCGKLFCSGGMEDPNYGRYVMFGDCKATFYDDPSNDFGQVDTGTKCGERLVCSQNECVDLQVAYKATNCSAKCSGNGECNHKNECWCQPGWLPPNCDTADGSTQLSKDVVIGIAVSVAMLVLGALIVLAIFLVKRRQKAPRQSSFPTPTIQAVSNPQFRHQHLKSTPQLHPEKAPRPSAPPLPPGPRQYDNFMAARQALRPPPPRV
ncbi:zinc metalloproteinase-disintegrin-like batroxstatin-1 isoform X2 [Denticeps clupeoides]|nr:zinc metalloproteinase-disintegrin-like batroxstatin-1 isoform X2 [Denticeps clupeoides]